MAIIGASDHSYYARSVFENLRRLGFPSEAIRLVNSNRAEAFGRPCAPRLDAPVDLAVIATPARSVPDVVRDCARAGVGACVVLSDGFAEVGAEGARLQSEAAAAARAGPLVLCGPNTLGLVVPSARLGAWGAPLPALHEGCVSMVFQSSGLLNLCLGLLSARGLGFGVAVSVGNEAGLTLADAMRFAIEDEATRIVITFLESVSDVAALRRALERADELRKPIIALRVGRSERARRNVLAHTGRLAASGAAWDGLFRQHGVVPVGNVDALLETTALFARAADAPLTGDGLGFVTISGGDCTLFADLAERVGVRLPEPSRRDALADLVAKPTLLGNPLDVENLLRADAEAFFRALDLFCQEPSFALVGLRLNLPERPDAIRESYARAARIARQHGKIPLFLSRASEPLDPSWHALFEELGVPFVQEYEKALRAVRALLEFRARRPRTPRRDRPRTVAPPHARGVLSMEDAVALLRAYDIPFAPTERVDSADHAVAAAARLGYPVAVKAAVAHKSDLGGVRLDVTSAAAVRLAYAEVAAHEGGQGVLVQRMERGVVECIAGISRDPQLGPVLLVGLGGVFVEVLRDVALRVPPISADDARAMLDELGGKALLHGARGRPAADVEQLIEVLLRLSDLACDQGAGIAELDLNPLIVRERGHGLVAVDALVSTEPLATP